MQKNELAHKIIEYHKTFAIELQCAIQSTKCNGLRAQKTTIFDVNHTPN